MTLRSIPAPDTSEYPSYSSIYMDLVEKDGNVLQRMRDTFHSTRSLVCSLPEEKLLYRYAEGKWSVKEVLVHLIDDERIFAYRALCYARADKTELPGFEQDDYAAFSEADERSLESIFEEYEAVRNSTIAMFNAFPEKAFSRGGTLTGNINKRTVRALVYHIAGHELWHLKMIRERYL